MFAPPKMILIALLAVAAWFAVRWLNRLPGNMAAPRGPVATPQGSIEDLVACRVCGAYVAPGAAGCAKPGCPQLR